MTVKNLSDTPFNQLLDCFLLAFENYYVPMPTDSNYYKERWKAAKVDFALSYGMFDAEKLVGFIIHAVDQRNGITTAYNTGTGVIPEYRGKGIVKSIYKYALADLQHKGIEKTTLEVITKNKVAVHVYESIGFKICKHYQCFGGSIATKTSDLFELQETNWKDVDWNHLPNQQWYSWDHQKESILEGNYRFFQVIRDKKPESYFIINPSKKYLAQLDLLTQDNTAWNRLFSAIRQVSDTIRINNVDVRFGEKLDALKMSGLANTVDQYEMELTL